MEGRAQCEHTPRVSAGGQSALLIEKAGSHWRTRAPRKDADGLIGTAQAG